MPQLSSQTVSIPGLPGSEILAIAPLSGSELIAVDRSGWLLYRFSLDTPEVTPERIVLQASLPVEHLKGNYDFKRHLSPITLCCSYDGRWLAWAQTLGLRGGVIDLQTGEQVHSLTRETHLPDTSSFSLGFVTIGGRLLLIHTTGWNRLDATEIESGRRLTERGPTEYINGKEPPHHLDYFYSGLSVSPGNTWLITNGWVWHPVGYMAAWRADVWLGEDGNVWESEDGPTRFALDETGAGYFWDRPNCWLDDNTLAFWGRGDDDEELEDAVGIYSLPERKLLRWIEGPQARDGFLAFDKDNGILIAVASKTGTSLWDIQSGEKLAENSTLYPRLWHSGLKALIATGDENSDAVHVIHWSH